MNAGSPQQVDEIDDDEMLTQYGSTLKPPGGPTFRRKPARDQTNVSLVRGKLTVEQVTALVALRDAGEEDCARHVVAKALRHEGFVVRHDPLPANPDHVAVEFGGPWTDSVGKRFDRACRESAKEAAA